jgi:mannose-1-phosphate guanylyltransferase
VAVIAGLKDFVVAEQGNVLMICPKEDNATLRRLMTDAQMKLGEEFI